MKHLAVLSALIISLNGCDNLGSSTPLQDHPSNTTQDTNTRGFAPEVQPIADTSALIPSGWRETVISVTNLDEMTAFYTDILGWEIRSQGTVPSKTLKAWNLPASTKARFSLVANPASISGFVRIIDFDGVEQVRIRNHSQAWETGGIYNMNIRVNDMNLTAHEVTNAGWQAPSAPVRFSFGPFIVKEWIPRHKDGIRIAFIERVTPPLEGWPNLKTTSRTFNSTQMVANMSRALEFYQGILGFKTYLEHRAPSDSQSEHVLGMSKQAMVSVTRDIRIVNPTGENEGSIELLQFENYSGRDFSERATPPNLGNLMLRFPVPDIEKLATYLIDEGVALEYEPITTSLAPYGQVKLIAIRAPDGAWLEFFEELDI